MNNVKKLEQELGKLNKVQLLMFLGMTFNEKGLRDIIHYYTIDSLDNATESDATEEVAGYMKTLKAIKN